MRLTLLATVLLALPLPLWSGDHGLEPDCIGRARRSILEADSADSAAGDLFQTADLAGGNAWREPPP